MIVFDSSALMKLLIDEPESAALEAWLDGRPGTPGGSELLGVEVLRGCRRVDPSAVPRARALLETLDLRPMTRELVNDAAELPDPLLRSLDAIHLASALSLRGDVSAFVTYDRRLAEAAARAGLHVVAPGS